MLTCLAGVLLPATSASAARLDAVEATGRSHKVVVFRLPHVRPAQVTRATLKAGGKRQRVSLSRVRRALRRTRVLSVRSKLRGRRIRLLMRVSTGRKTRPNTTLVDGPSGTVDTRTATFRFDADRDGVGYECRLDRGAWSACSSPKTYTDVADGTHLFAVRARIKGGLADTTAAVRRWTVDGPEPAPAAPAASSPAPGKTPSPATPAAPGLTDRVVPVSGSELLRDDFDGADGLITNGYAYWDPSDSLAARSSVWENETASFFRRGNTGWSGVPDGINPNRTSSNGTGSQVFRMWTKRDDFADVLVTMKLRTEAYSNGDSGWPAKSWDGLKLWLRRGGRTGSHDLYTVEVNRRQGNVMIQKKCAGSDDYHILKQTSSNSMPASFGTWETVGGSVKNNADGTVSLTLIRDGRVVLEGLDDGVGGCAPIRAGGRVGIRGDNAQFSVDDFVVSRA